MVGLRRYAIALFTLFNFADLGGKSLPMWRTLVFHDHRGILYAAIARVIFVPAFFVARHHLGPAGIGFLTFTFGVTNGYLTALAMMAAPIALEVRPCESAFACAQAGLRACAAGPVMPFFAPLC